MKRYLPAILLFASMAALVFGVVQLFELRFEAGDVYPEYSSLRSDPLGTMAFYESLAGLPGFSVRRNFSTTNRLPDGRDTTYFLLSTSIIEWRQLPEATFREIQQFVSGGGRLVITMFPQSARSLRPRERERVESGPKDQKAKVTSFRERWGVDFQIIDLTSAPDDV